MRILGEIAKTKNEVLRLRWVAEAKPGFRLRGSIIEKKEKLAEGSSVPTIDT